MKDQCMNLYDHVTFLNRVTINHKDQYMDKNFVAHKKDIDGSLVVYDKMLA